MKRLLIAGVAVAVCAGCEGRRVVPGVEAMAAAPAVPGTVTLSADSPMLTQITRAMVGVADLPTDEVIAPGKIDANPNRIAKVVLPVSGRVISVLVKTGDAVAKDQPLLTIRSPDADAATSTFLSAQASVTQAQAGLVKVQADFDRSSDLYAHNAVAKKRRRLERKCAWPRGKAAVDQANAALEQARRRLAGLGLTPGDLQQDVVVRSPLAGKVLELSIVPGEFRNDTSASLMTIADLSTVWVTSHVPETYIRFVQVGERVEITLVAYPGETFVGRVSRIADTVDPQTRAVRVQAEMDNPRGRFRPEMYGSIHHVQSTASIPVVPAAAVVQDGDRTVVFVEDAPGHFTERQVSLGKPAGGVVRVQSGVVPGNTIAVDGVMLLKGLVTRS